MKLLGKLICWRKGHKRHRRVPGTELMKCPRCDHVTVRKPRRLIA